MGVKMTFFCYIIEEKRSVILQENITTLSTHVIFLSFGESERTKHFS